MNGQTINTGLIGLNQRHIKEAVKQMQLAVIEMGVTNLQLCSLLTKFTALNGLNTYYFDPKTNGFRSSWKLQIYCVIHHGLCVLALAHMSYSTASNVRVGVTVLTIGGTTACCVKSCWDKAQGIRKLARGLVKMEQKYFSGRDSRPLLKYRYYMKITFVLITLLRIHLFHPIYMRRLLLSQFYVNVGAYWLLYNMLLAAVLGFYFLLWEMCRIQKLINDLMAHILARSRRRNRLTKMLHCLRLYSKLLLLCDQFNNQLGHVSVWVLACKSWFQITYGYEIYQMVAAPKSIDLSMAMRLFVIFSYILDAINLFVGTDISELFSTFRADSARILREANCLDRLLSIFTLKLALHPKGVVFLNVFTFDRKLTLTLLAKSTLYTICWLQNDYNKLKA
ncbi:uncharacterized protein Dyak_GE19357 [Drosophila yakuba]|uniref:Gustatory receptor n=1 Tax=Drosophila yakuba TaxID=7245 RepID=B4NXM2_DROYA|nr:uncharacterized protein Dyak_GE19357 [Drosophila yakuba]